MSFMKFWTKTKDFLLVLTKIYPPQIAFLPKFPCSFFSNLLPIPAFEMQQELGLIRAQLNLIQQTLNVVLEKVGSLEEDKKERDEQRKLMMALTRKAKKKSALVETLEKWVF